MSQPGARRQVLRGMWLVATFRKEGFGHFAATREAYVASLTPIAALVVVAGLAMAAHSGLGLGVRVVLVLACGILAPQVVSHFLASRIGREPRWLGYSVAFNWSQWAVPAVAVAVLVGVGILTATGMPDETASGLARLGITGYAVALYVFITRHGLGLSMLGAFAFIVAVNLATSAMLFLPSVIETALN